MSSDRNRSVELALVGALFASSGAAALVYQVAWQRILALHTGIGVYSVATIVAAFMLGLGLGSHWGGGLSARLSPRRALLAFAALELAIGAFAALSCLLYYDILYRRAGFLYASLLTAAPAHVISLIVPTTLMGMSLPLLVRAMIRQRDRAGSAIGYLYSVNVLGAAMGALLTPWVLVRQLGIDGAVLMAAGASAATGIGALAVGRIFPPPEHDAEREEAVAVGLAPPAPPGISFGALLVLYALSGLCSLSLEIVWFRIVDVAVKSTAFTFGSVLTIYLLGLAAGSFIGTAIAPRLRDPMRTFLLCQSAILVCSAGAVVALAWLPTDWPGYRWFYGYWPGYSGFQLGLDADPLALLRLYLLFPAALYGLPTVLMGVSFVALQQSVQDDVHLAGFKVGRLQAANIAGGVLGSLGTGLVALDLLGSTGTLRLLTLCGAAFVVLGWRRAGARPAFALLGVSLLALALLIPGQRRFWQRLHAADETALIEEDATSVVAITEGGARGLQMMVNGKGISWIPFGGIHSVMGAAPALVHEAPADVAIVGLGSGDTAWAAACRKPTRSLTVFEISAPQPRLLRALLEREVLPDLRRLLSDPRVLLRIDDGRNAIERGTRLYDVIQADPLPPWGAFSGNLYSSEFFEGCLRKLKPGGLMCTWSPTPRVHATFSAVFPYVIELTHGQFQYLIGSREPIGTDPARWLARLADGEVAAYLGASISADVKASLVTARRARPIRDMEIEPNRDLYPRDELRIP